MKISLFELKEDLGIRGEYLLTRPIARQFVHSIHGLIEKGAKSSEAIEFNFERIQSSDTSFIDELIIVNVLKKMGTKGLPHFAVLLSGMHQSTLENARSVFTVQKIPILVKNGEDPLPLIGRLEKNLTRVLRLLLQKKQLKAVELAKSLHLTISVASTKLAALHKKHLAIRQEEISNKGREYTYYSPI